MEYKYPVILTMKKDSVFAIIPDFIEIAEADTIDEVLVAVREIIALCISDIKDMNKSIPEPTLDGFVLGSDQKLVWVTVSDSDMETVETSKVSVN